MKKNIFLVFGAVAILTSCGSKGEGEGEGIQSARSVENIAQMLRGTTWELSTIVDRNNLPLKKTTLEFDANRDSLVIKNNNGNVNLCGIMFGGEFKIKRSETKEEYLVVHPNDNCGTFISVRTAPSMAIVKLENGKISLKREVVNQLHIANGKIQNSVIHKEEYRKK